MKFLKQSTAVTLFIGPFWDETDGYTPEESLTIAQADVRLSKNGGDFAQKDSSSSATHDDDGYYSIPFSTTDTNTLGILTIAISKSGARPVREDFMVVPANVYDSLISASDDLDVQISAFDADIITSAVFDEDTAFPLKQADTGSTAVARVGADGDTLETLSDQLDLALTSAGLIAAGGVNTGITGTFSIRRLDTWSGQITGLGDISARDELYVAIKAAISDADNSSKVLWEESVGLSRVNGQAAAAATDGTITVDNADNGDISLTLNSTATGSLVAATGLYVAVKSIDSDGDITTWLGSGSVILDDAIEAVS